MGLVRIGLFPAGAALLLSCGSFVKVASLDFGRVAGLYFAALFVVWQVINIIAFESFATMPILVGGALVIAGGRIVGFLKPLGKIRISTIRSPISEHFKEPASIVPLFVVSELAATTASGPDIGSLQMRRQA